MKGFIITVHYNEKNDLLLEFINNLNRFLNEELILIILNNNPNKEVSSLINEIFQNRYIKVYDLKHNLGYFGAFKYFINNLFKGNFDFLIICNDDTEVINEDFFKYLKKEFYNTYKNYDIIAPSIITSEGIEQNPHSLKKPDILKIFYYKIYFSFYYLAIIFDKLIMTRKKICKSNSYNNINREEIFSPHGAFIIIKKSFFNKGGYIEDGFYMYGEEYSLACQAVNSNIKIIMDPSLKVLHKESITIGKKLSYKKYCLQKKAFNFMKNKYPSIFNFYKRIKMLLKI